MVHKTIGYHTVEDTANPTDIERNAPFISTRTAPFLSHGFYFWEKDLDWAHTFGDKTYGEYNYVICECKLHLYNMFDFVANPDHSAEYLRMEEVLPTIYTDMDPTLEYPIGVILDLLRKRNIAEPGVFEYDSVRAIYEVKSEQEVRLFVNGRREVINIRPRIMICLFEKTKLNLVEVNIVFPADYV